MNKLQMEYEIMGGKLP